jgi:hypothetical protein
MLIQHLRADWTFPPPWPDESHFLLQAAAFAEHDSLLSPELNPQREILWMPPGYVVLSGLVFKITGVSFGVARSMSFVFVAASLIMFAMLLRSTHIPKILLPLCGLMFLSAPVAASANTARAEALLLLLVCAAGWLLYRRDTWSAIGIFAIGPLVHPNGVYFLASAVVYTVISTELRQRWRSPRWTGISVAVVAVCAWTVYILHISAHWQDFVTDMSFQMARKSGRDIVGVLFAFESVLLMATVAVSAWYGHRHRLNVGLFAALAVWALIKIRQ